MYKLVPVVYEIMQGLLSVFRRKKIGLYCKSW